MPQTLSDIACPRCSCLCDDLVLQVSEGRITGVEGACNLSERWWLQQSAAADMAATIEGKAASLTEAVERACEVLRASRTPLILGLNESNTAGQRAACELADRLGATIDPMVSAAQEAALVAFQSVGASTATLGEVRHRADLVICWGCDPVETQPRLLERCVEQPGKFIPGGRSDRKLIVIDSAPTATSAIADQFVQLPPGGQLEVLWTLRALLKGVEVPELNLQGVDKQALASLIDQLKAAKYGAVFFGPSLAGEGLGHSQVEALLRLVTELNAHTRFVVRSLCGSRNSSGAENVLCWQSGFASSVNFARGFPRSNPGEYSADAMLRRKETDAVVLVGSSALHGLSSEATEHLRAVPQVMLDSSGDDLPFEPSVRFCTAISGVHRDGTAYRFDDVPIPLRAVLPSKLPSDEEVLKALVAALA